MTNNGEVTSVFSPVCLHVVPVINNMAFSPKRGWETGEGGHLNKPTTTVTQTKALDRREWKIDENKRQEQGPCMYPTVRVGDGGRGGLFKWRVGKRGGGASPVLIRRCPFSFPANPETQQQPCALQQAAKMPPVSSKPRRAMKSSFASELASLDDFRYTKTNIGLFVNREGSCLLPRSWPCCMPTSFSGSQPASHPCTHAAYSAIKTMLP